MTAEARDWARKTWLVDVPEGEHGSVRIERFEVPKNSIESLRLAMSGRGCPPGTYTKMLRNGRLWMSDTPAEQRDHMAVDWEIQRRGGRVLVMGLGLGMIVHRALQHDKVEHVDVVEIDPDVAALVGPHYEKSGRVTVHVGDAFAMKWPAGTRWSVAWHDVWPDLTEDNLPEMARLARSYGRRVDWQGFWGKEEILRHRRSDRRYGW